MSWHSAVTTLEIEHMDMLVILLPFFALFFLSETLGALRSLTRQNSLDAKVNLLAKMILILAMMSMTVVVLLVVLYFKR